jgi:trehalose synthase-fused probable maltokinase
VIDSARLAELLPRHRWFGGKDRTIREVEIWDEATLDDGSPALVVALAAVHFADATSGCYHVLLLVDGEGGIRDAFEDVERVRVLGRLMSHGETIKGSSGVFHFGGPGLDPSSPPGTDSIRALGLEQSNSSVVMDEAVILKLFRRVEPGPNPELELTRLLTAEGFEGIPAQVGEILFEGEIDDAHAEIDLGVAQQLIDGREGWSEMLDAVGKLYDTAGGVDVVEQAVEEHAGASLDELGRLGDVTASLHVVLAREGLEPDVAAEPVDNDDLSRWVQLISASLQSLLDSGIEELGAYEAAMRARIEELTAVGDPGRKTRTHGDYHLGQVLLATRGWMILDLEGEPARSLAERRAKQSPLRDVAGMLRSFSYVANAALFERAKPDSTEWRRLEPWADAWEQAARQRFVGAYLATSHEGGFLPPDRDEMATMLDAFELEKALYEVSYERAHRPAWLRIPLRGIARVLDPHARR